MKKGKVMKKRILSAVVVLVLFAGVLAGCISGHGTQEAKLNIMDDNYLIIVTGNTDINSSHLNPSFSSSHYNHYTTKTTNCI